MTDYLHHVHDSDLEAIAAVDPVDPNALNRLDLDDAFAALLTRIEKSGTPQPRRRRTRTAVVALGACGLALVGSGVAAAAWHSAHTGIHGTPGQTENDTSEFLDSSGADFPVIAQRLAAKIPFAPGDGAASYIPVVFDPQETGLIQKSGVRATLAFDAFCGWEGSWLQAHDHGDAAALRTATRGLSRAPTWPAVRHMTGDTTQFGVSAQAARAGDPGPIRTDWTANCTELPKAWAK